MQVLLPDEDISCVEHHSEDALLAAGTSNGAVALWDSRLAEPQTRCPLGHGAEIGALKFRPAHPHALCVALETQILSFDIRCLSQSTNPAPVSSYNVSRDDIGCLDFNEEGTFIASADDHGDVAVIDLSSEKILMQCTAHDNICSAAAFSPYAENEIFSGGLDCCMKSWDIESCEAFWEETMLSEAQTQMINPPMVFDIAVPQTSRWQGLVAAARGDGAIYLRTESEDGSSTSAVLESAEEGHRSVVSTLTFLDSCSGEKIISGGVDCRVILWDWTSEGLCYPRFFVPPESLLDMTPALANLPTTHPDSHRDMHCRLPRLPGSLRSPHLDIVPESGAAMGHLLKRNDRSIALGAHRGMGKNIIEAPDHATGRRGWRENTIKSFLKAAESGASFIEFDVQVTKDGVPIVFHDETITYGTSEYCCHARIRDLTFDEFCSIGHHQPREHPDHYPKRTLFRDNGAGAREWKCQDEDKLPSLEDVFHHVPDHVDFNIEIKTFGDASQQSTPAEEIEFVITAVLSVVNLSTRDRTIVFSSFDPDMVQKLKKAQPHATMFLSDGESDGHIDPRRSSFAAAMQWAHVNGLDGIVLHSNALRQQQDVVREASALGLTVMTYGTDNDDHEWVVSQFCLGVHGAIVDDVAGIARKLFGSSLDWDS